LDTIKQIQQAKETITLKQVIAAVVFVGIFFIPFSSFSGISFLGEFSKEPAAIFFFGAFFLLLVLAAIQRKIAIPFNNLLFQVVLLLIAWFFITTVLNIPAIHNYYFKGIGGYERFIRQYAVLLISAVFFFLTYYNVFINYSSKELFTKVRRVFLFSMVIVTAYGFFEILIVKFGMGVFYNVINLFDYFPFTNVYLHGGSRISSVTFEAPALATYLLTVSGWMFSYIITEKGMLRFVPSLAIIVLALFSDSRAALVVIFLQIVVFGFLLLKKKRHHQLFIKIAALSTVAILVIGVAKGDVIAEYITEKLTSFGVEDDQHSISNRSRFGIQQASLMVFEENPIIGVGYGQQAYEARERYPRWATAGNWEFKLKYLNQSDPQFPPGYNIYTRILAEGGIIGMIIFASLLILIMWVCLVVTQKNDDRYLLALVILISMVGFYFNWLKMDTVRVFGFWINLALLVAITRKTRFVANLKQRNE
jgi:O-antigen ligase